MTYVIENCNMILIKCWNAKRGHKNTSRTLCFPTNKKVNCYFVIDQRNFDEKLTN